MLAELWGEMQKKAAVEDEPAVEEFDSYYSMGLKLAEDTFDLEKSAGGKTYPISRFLTSPRTAAGLEAAQGAILGGAVGGPVGAAVGAGARGALGYGGGRIARWVSARGARGRHAMGGGAFYGTEKRLAKEVLDKERLKAVLIGGGAGVGAGAGASALMSEKEGEEKQAGAARQAASSIAKKVRGKPALALGVAAAGGAGAAGYAAGKGEGREDLLEEQQAAALERRRQMLRQRIMAMLGSGGYAR